MRDDSISIAKAIAIIAMVLGHSLTMQDEQNYVEAFVNMFHVGVFYFFAGYCFKEKYLVDFNIVLRQRIKGLYIPYVKYGLLFLLSHN